MSSAAVAAAGPAADLAAAPQVSLTMPTTVPMPEGSNTKEEAEAAAAAARAHAAAADTTDKFSSPPLTQLLNDLSLKNTASAVVYRVVLTGGPCGGKTTAMSTLTERFQALGWRVFRVPEAATMLLSGGHSFANLDSQQYYQFQAALLKLMLSLEEAFITLARSTHDRCIVLCDRGTMDCRSYMAEEEWEQLVTELGTSTLALRDERYDCVVHMVTAANGAEDFYTIEGHAARHEPASVARELDLKIQANWVGHPYFHIIDNGSEGFRGKIRRVMSTICQFVGLQGSVGMSKRKFLVSPSCIEKVVAKPGTKGFDADRVAFPDEVRYQKFEVDHDYIVRPEQDQTHQLRLRRRGLNGQYTYSYTLRYPDLHGQRVELKRLVNRREYFDLLLQKDPAAQTVSKKRYSFLWQNAYYELDQFVSPHKGLYLLEFYAEKDRDVSKMLPSFLRYEREVTNDPQYSMRVLAQRSLTSPHGESPAAGFKRNGRSASVTHTTTDAEGGFETHSLAVPEKQHSGNVGLTHACISAPTTPQLKAAKLTTATDVTEHKL